MFIILLKPNPIKKKKQPQNKQEYIYSPEKLN